MAANVLMPISPPGSSQGLSLAPSGGQLSGKYLRSTGLKSRGSRDGTNDGSLTKKGLGTHTKNGNLVKETRIKKNVGAVVRDIDSLRYVGIILFMAGFIYVRWLEYQQEEDTFQCNPLPHPNLTPLDSAMELFYTSTMLTT